MTKKNIIVAVVVLAIVAVLTIGGYLYWSKEKSTEPADSATSSVQSAVDAVDNITKSATQGVLPSIGEAANPLSNKPDLNPKNKTNPFNVVKTNPFQ